MNGKSGLSTVRLQSNPGVLEATPVSAGWRIMHHASVAKPTNGDGGARQAAVRPSVSDGRRYSTKVRATAWAASKHCIITIRLMSRHTIGQGVGRREWAGDNFFQPTEASLAQTNSGDQRVSNGMQYPRAASIFFPSVPGRPSKRLSFIDSVRASSISATVLIGMPARMLHVTKWRCLVR